jgi:flagellar protein FlaF
MTTNAQARSGYAAAAAPIRTARGTEYAVFAQVTRRMSAVDETDRTAFPQLAQAVLDNQRLWGTLADDLMLDANALPVPLRAQLVSLAGFVQRHSLAVLGGRASMAPLVDINTAIMKGLRGNAEVAA